MDTKLIRKALADAYYLLYQERESVCLDWLSEEYDQVLNTLMRAMEEVDNEENKQ